jgi:hypothetical protein
MKKPSFYMSAYLIYVICSAINFPSFGWNWDPSQLPIPFYSSQWWDVNYKKHIYDLCGYFLSPLHNIIFGYTPYKISKEAMATLKYISKWYMETILYIYQSLREI